MPRDLAASESADLASAEALFAAHRYSEARLVFERLLTVDPANPDIHYYLGQLALEREDIDTAIRELERAGALVPGSARYHHALGIAYGHSAEKAGILSRFSLARKCLAEFQRSVQLDPDNVDYHESLFEYYSRAPAIVGGGGKRAAAEAAAIKKIDPKRGHQAYAVFFIADGKFDLAFAELDEVLKGAPEDYTSLYEVGRLAAISGQHLDRGAESLRLCLKLPVPRGAPPRSAVEWRLGNILEKQGHPDGARVAYEAALTVDPKFVPAVDALKNLK